MISSWWTTDAPQTHTIDRYYRLVLSTNYRILTIRWYDKPLCPVTWSTSQLRSRLLPRIRSLCVMALFCWSAVSSTAVRSIMRLSTQRLTRCVTTSELKINTTGKKRPRLHNSTLYVVRLMNDGTTGYSKPCYHCIEILKQYGIKKVCYTTGDLYSDHTAWKIERIDQIINPHITTGEKKRQRLKSTTISAI